MSNDIEEDARRAVLLGGYIRAWGTPSQRVSARRRNDVVEVYSFPAPSEGKLNRYATVGVSSLRRDSGSLATWELYFVVPSDNAGASEARVTSFILDVMAYSLRSDVQFTIGKTIPSSAILPVEWNARAVLLDEPRGEPEYLADVHVGIQHVKLLWLVPIYADERDLILREGVEAFDRAESASDWSLADPRRPSFCSTGMRNV